MRPGRIALLPAVTLVLLTSAARAALVPESDLWDIWDASDETSTATIDHSRWQALLDRYLVADHSSGINRFDYGAMTEADRSLLGDYLGALQAIDPRTFSRAEQRAYWINLYNAVTVDLVVDHYPVKSIRKINGGLLGLGPWGDPVVLVAEESLSLNDIEHRILRPICGDPRIHYAVNCASLGCPNLAGLAYTATNTESLLEAGARAYINHPRGVELANGRLRLSSIYKWFKVDFGGTDERLLVHLRKYAEPELARQLAAYDGRIRYDYDWDLNAP